MLPDSCYDHCLIILNIQRMPKRSLQVPQYPQNSLCGATESEPPSDSSWYNLSASSFVSGPRLMVKLLPSTSFLPMLSNISVAIMRVPLSMGRDTCITLFFSASDKAGAEGFGGMSFIRISGELNSDRKTFL